MAISLKEFQVAMDVLDAQKLYDRELSIYDNILVPCFKVGDVTLTYSGFSYIEPLGSIIPKNIFFQAIVEFGQELLDSFDLEYGTVLTLRGLVVISLMLQNRYSKELANSLIDRIYSILLSYPKIKFNFGIPFTLVPSSKIKELCAVVSEYDNCVNPFATYYYVLRPASSFLDDVTVNLIVEETDIVNLTLYSKMLNTEFRMSVDGFQYFTCAWYDSLKSIHRPHVAVTHLFHTGHDGNPVDEIISIDRSIIGHLNCHPNDVHLNISIHSGLAWETGNKHQATIATDEQIDIAIAFLRSSIRKIRNNILSNILVTTC